MTPDVVSFAQDRIATAVSEQLWAVALVGALNAFVASHSEKLLDGFRRSVLIAGIAFTSTLALFFIWSRHLIFMHYDGLAKAALGASTPGALCPTDRVAPTLVFIAGWSGVWLYTLVVLGATIIAIRMLSATTNAAPNTIVPADPDPRERGSGPLNSDR